MNKQEFLVSIGIQEQMLEFWIEQRWLIPDEGAADPSFSARDLARARLILDLKGDLRVNDEGIDLVLHLLDQIHGLRSALAEIRETAPLASR
jgi:chaperone modulatory protein CbpM